MNGTRPLSRKPLALLVGRHLWLLRSLESILTSNGFAVVVVLGDPGNREFPAFEADLVIVEADNEEPWPEVLGQVRREARIGPVTPVIATTAEPLSRRKRLEALRAGAWEVLGHPLDAEVLVLKATMYARAKFEADEARERGLIDPETDLYNVRGVMRRIYEEASEAARQRQPLACLVAAMDAAATPDMPSPDARAAAQALRRTARSSDVFGRLGATEFVVIAPGTDAGGALSLAQRLTAESGPTSLPRLHAGYAAVSDAELKTIEPVDLFVRAVVALRAAQALGSGERIRSFN